MVVDEPVDAHDMQTKHALNANPMSLTAELRAQAVRLLQRLMADRELSERRSSETGRRDPMKAITGRTAFDTAIAATQDIIRQIDDAQSRPCAVEPKRTHSNSLNRPARRVVPLAAAS